MTPRDLPDPGRPPQPVKTLTRWDSFLGELAAGTKLADAMKKCYITRADIETCTRSEPLQMQRYNEARLAAQVRAWSVLDLEEIFDRVASGMKVAEAVKEVTGGEATTRFYALINRDADLLARFKQAQEACAISRMEEILPIADDTSGDTLDTGGKSGVIPNNAAVARAKLRVDSRFRAAGLMNSRLYGEKKDQVNVQVNINHAEQLEAARERAKTRDKPIRLSPPRQVPAVVDAVFTDAPSVPTADDTSWMDDKPADTVWREEA